MEHPYQPRVMTSLIYRNSRQGSTDKRWINWFDGLTITLEDNGHTR